MVCLDTPTSRATSSAFRPASTCFNAAMISASVCLPLDMLLPLSDLRNHIQFRADLGEQVSSSRAQISRPNHCAKCGKQQSPERAGISTRQSHSSWDLKAFGDVYIGY